jgi:two-component system heavy metal sensor histidine kinase CusS
MFALCGAIVFVIGGVLLHASLQSALERQVRDELTLRASLIESVITMVPTAQFWKDKIVPKLESMAALNGGIRVWIEAEPPFRFGDAPPELEGKVVQAAGHGSVEVAGQPCDFITLVHQLPAYGERPPMRLVLASDPMPFSQTIYSFRIALIAMIAAGVTLVALLGYWIARVGLRPLARLSRQAEALSPSNRAERLGFDPLPAELWNLTASFNGALERLEQAYTKLEAFNADVAHELRTPLTNLIGQTQVALSRQRDVRDLEEVLQSNLEELDRMRGIVNDMLFLAQADRGTLVSSPSHASLSEEVRKVMEFLEPLMEERGVCVRLDGDARVPVETSLFRRAVSNLLQNAIEHSSPGHEIVVRVEHRDGTPCVSVSNPGSLIEDTHLAHLFERFYRVDSSRTNSGGNHGLGLSIVKAVASMHRGIVFASSEAGWNTFGFTVAPTR